MKYILISSILLLFTFSMGCSKLPEEELLNSITQNLEETDDFIILSSPDTEPTKTFIFYPGGLVDPHSYLAWQDKLIQEIPDLRIVTVKMPSNLAVMNSGKGELLFDHFKSTELWIAGGHSLGGAMSTVLVNNNRSKIEGLIYLAAYPSDEKIKDYSGSVFSISAEFDGLATPSDISSHIDDLPEAYNMSNENDFPTTLQGKTLYYEIKGGNHAQFGNYGSQENDLEPSISQEEQQITLHLLIKNYLDQL